MQNEQDSLMDKHPTTLSDNELLADCETTRQRRSGPGGQHRNKVETAIRLLHRPTGLTGQASERRSQADNLKQALTRLRVELALHHRIHREVTPGTLWKSRIQGKKLVINPDHRDFPALLAEALDILSAENWDHKQAAERLQVSSSQLVKFLKLEPEGLQLLNQHRKEMKLNPLS